MICGRTPTHQAAINGHIKVLKLPIDSGANINTLDQNFKAPLMLAAMRSEDSLEHVQALLRGGADLSTRNVDGQTVLHVAALCRNWAVVIFIINNFANVNLRTRSIYGESAYAAILARSSQGQLFHSFALNIAPNPNVFESTWENILSKVTLSNRPMFMKMLLRRLPRHLIPNLLRRQESQLGTPLYVAAISSADKVMDMLLAAGAELDFEGGEHGTPLMGACATGRLEMVRMLVARGAKTSYVSGNSIVSALTAARSQKHVVRWLLVGRYTGLRFITEGDD